MLPQKAERSLEEGHIVGRLAVAAAGMRRTGVLFGIAWAKLLYLAQLGDNALLQPGLHLRGHLCLRRRCGVEGGSCRAAPGAMPRISLPNKPLRSDRSMR